MSGVPAGEPRPKGAAAGHAAPARKKAKKKRPGVASGERPPRPGNLSEPQGKSPKAKAKTKRARAAAPRPAEGAAPVKRRRRAPGTAAAAAAASDEAADWEAGEWDGEADAGEEGEGNAEADVVIAPEVDPEAAEEEMLAALRDISLPCRECGGKFLFTARSQRWFVKSGLENFPVRCPGCRREKQEFFSDAVGTTECFKCQQKGHWASHCPNAPVDAASKCFRCGERGHFSRECPNLGSIHKSGRCCNCGAAGHRAFDCPLPKKKASICMDFVDGTCTRGSLCKYAHELRRPQG